MDGKRRLQNKKNKEVVGVQICSPTIFYRWEETDFYGKSDKKTLAVFCTADVACIYNRIYRSICYGDMAILL